jgi:hypothetical protein
LFSAATSAQLYAAAIYFLKRGERGGEGWLSGGVVPKQLAIRQVYYCRQGQPELSTASLLRLSEAQYYSKVASNSKKALSSSSE